MRTGVTACALQKAGLQKSGFERVGGKSHAVSGHSQTHVKGNSMNNIVYIVGAVVIIIALLSFFGLR